MTEKHKNNGLSLLSWNLWFEEFAQIERLMAVLSFIEPLQPDIIAFQEMTNVSQSLFDQRMPDIHADYRKVAIGAPREQWYWEGLYTRLPIGPMSRRFRFKSSEMGRGLTVLDAPALDLVVGCFHLESEFEHPIRRRQFAEAIHLLESFEANNQILLGDTNTRTGDEIDDLLPEGWADAWKTLRPDDPGFTVNTKINPMGYGKRLDRLDRLYYACRDYVPVGVRLLGTDPLHTEDGAVFLPSDHFGLWVDFRRKDDQKV